MLSTFRLVRELIRLSMSGVRKDVFAILADALEDRGVDNDRLKAWSAKIHSKNDWLWEKFDGQSKDSPEAKIYWKHSKVRTRISILLADHSRLRMFGYRE